MPFTNDHGGSALQCLTNHVMSVHSRSSNGNEQILRFHHAGVGNHPADGHIRRPGDLHVLQPGKFATRKAYGVALRALGHITPDVVVLDADVSNSTFAETFGALTTTADPYSLFLGVRVRLNGNGTATGDFRVNVPEPASLALLGLGLIGFARFRRSRN